MWSMFVPSYCLYTALSYLWTIHYKFWFWNYVIDSYYLMTFDWTIRGNIQPSNAHIIWGQHCVQSTAQDGLTWFGAGENIHEVLTISICASMVHDDFFCQLIESGAFQTTNDSAYTLEVYHKTIFDHLRQVNKLYKLAQWTPHELTDHDHQRRAEAAVSLLSYSRTYDWLSTMISGDKNFCLYFNIKRLPLCVAASTIPQPQPKPGLQPGKLMLCIWRNCKSVTNF